METEHLEQFDFHGTPTTRGHRHGETLRARIRWLLDLWQEGIGRLHGLSADAYVERFFSQTRFRQALTRYAPVVVDEVRAIAAAANVDSDQLLAFQHVNEEFWFDSKSTGEACSTIAMAPAGENPALIAQNLDLDSYLDGHQILINYNCDTSEGRILALSVPGMICLNGMNSFGVAVCDNALVQLRTDRAGLPAFALYRLALEAPDLKTTQQIIADHPHASGLNWVMGDPAGVCMVEASAGAKVACGGDDPSRPLFHTNHPLHNRDLTPDRLQSWAQKMRARPSRSSHLRYAALQERLGAMRGPLTIDDIKTILSSRDDPDYPVSRSGGTNEDDIAIGFTLACCIFELRAREPRLHIASGPPDRTSFRTFTV